jgi:hypothetical protein
VHDRAKEMRLGRASIRNWPSESNLLSVMSVALCHAAMHCIALSPSRPLCALLFVGARQRAGFSARRRRRRAVLVLVSLVLPPRPRLGYLFPAIASAIRVRGLRFRHKALGSGLH